MATTTNYSWTTPDDTALVKDGAAAIRSLGSSADTTVKALNPGTTAGDIDYYTTSTAKARVGIGTAGQVLQVNSGATAPEWATPATGLTLIKTQTIGSAVSSIAVTNVFSSTYDNYFIIVSGGVGSTNNYLNLTLGNTATGYYQFSIYGLNSGTAVTGYNVTNGTAWLDVCGATANTIYGQFTLSAPNLAKRTSMSFGSAQAIAGGVNEWAHGFLDNTTQYTDFTFTTNTGTVTGGTIKVYGYKN